MSLLVFLSARTLGRMHAAARAGLLALVVARFLLEFPHNFSYAYRVLVDYYTGNDFSYYPFVGAWGASAGVSAVTSGAAAAAACVP